MEKWGNCKLKKRQNEGYFKKDTLELSPSIPENWDYFRVDNLNFKGEKYSIIYDKTGKKYNQGKGLKIIKV